MNSSTSTFDEKWGTDYEGCIGLGGNCFRPLSYYSELDAEGRERLVAFQTTLLESVYSFVYEAPPERQRWLGAPSDVWCRHKIINKPPLLTLIVVLGQSYNQNADANVDNIAYIVTQAEKSLRDEQLPSFELLVTYRDFIWAYLGAIWLTEDDNPAPDLFYRLR